MRRMEKMIVKPCFACHTKGHHLSRNQYRTVLEKHKDRKGRINYKRVEQDIKNSKMNCNLCHGDKYLTYN